MESKTSGLVGDPNDPRSETLTPQPPSGECNVADPGDERCSPAAVKVILASLPADQREVFSSALRRVGEEERQRFHVVSAAVWQLVYESACEIGRFGATMPKDVSASEVFSVARRLKAEADRIYWIAKSFGFDTFSSEDIWLKAIVGLEEIEDKLPPNSRTELIEMFRLTHEDYYVRHYWQRAAEEATGRSLFAFCGNGAMSPTTLREWLKGKDIAPHNWRRFKEKLLKELPDDKKYLADQIPGPLHDPFL